MAASMINPPVRHSRLIRQENKRMAKQTVMIIGATIIFIIGFFTVGIPGLMNLAVMLGNSKASSKFAAEEDKIPPFAPLVNPLPEATTSGSLTIDGYTESGAVVQLFLDNSKISESAADNLGNFSFLDIKLNEGVNTFSVQSVDAAENKSPMSATMQVTFDNEPPTISVETPKDGTSIYGDLNRLIDITGTTEVDVQLTVNERQIVVTGDGSFAIKYELQEGDNKLSFTATDPAGNQTVEEISVNFSR